MSVISNYNCMQKDFLGHAGEQISKNIFLFPISLIGEMVFSTNIYKLVLTQREKHFQGLFKYQTNYCFKENFFIFSKVLI